MLSLQNKLFLVGALCLGLVSLARAIPVLAASPDPLEADFRETIQVEGGLAISGEFTGASVGKAEVEERTFTTLLAPASAVVIDQIVSPETTFRTRPISSLPSGELKISDEFTFQTAVQPETPSNPSGGGSSTSLGASGGGSSGGGYGPPAGGSLPVPSSPVGECPVYLTKFIHFGWDNDPMEVLKLQRFLRDYEGFALVPLSGIYDLATYRAVMAFQTRYADAILKPWGIDYPTGYVYITTTLAINNLYCERDPATTLDLRFTSSGIEGSPATTSLENFSTTTPIGPWLEVGVTTSTNRFLAAALGVLDFFKQIPVWLWVMLILIILASLLFVVVSP